MLTGLNKLNFSLLCKQLIQDTILVECSCTQPYLEFTGEVVKASVRNVTYCDVKVVVVQTMKTISVDTRAW